ncbi:hypothetical protein Sango_1177700 [Sesamum angolense]|uniref:Uncharacterized protein n=1 Tax=Sesamum angolense TaxID=2727404 RepID=A0AAE2BWU2_9LAMI|nr:hypothetical protein Sango_1177700 [Sesamum angolense]
MMRDVKAFVRRCPTCQHSKYSTQKSLGTLQPLPLPRWVWEDISMDFITHLPASVGKTVVWVVVDRLSKSAHFVGLPSRFSAASLAAVFSTEIYRLRGMPKSITEVLNRVLETFLRCFVSEEPKRWMRFLHLAEFWYNTSYHSSLHMSPFQALFGRPPPVPGTIWTESPLSPPLTL